MVKNPPHRDCPGGPVVGSRPSNAGDMGSIPGQGTRIPHASEQLSPCATTTEPACPRACEHSERSRCSQINKIEKKRIHLTLQCRGHGFESWSGGRTPHASGQLRLLISPRARVSATRDTSPLEPGRGRCEDGAHLPLSLGCISTGPRRVLN